MANDADQRQAEDKKSKQRFLLISAMRFAGVVMILLGIAVIRGLFPLPEWTAYVLIGLGLVETFITPQILARMWSTKAQDNRPR